MSACARTHVCRACVRAEMRWRAHVCLLASMRLCASKSTLKSLYTATHGKYSHRLPHPVGLLALLLAHLVSPPLQDFVIDEKSERCPEDAKTAHPQLAALEQAVSAPPSLWAAAGGVQQQRISFIGLGATFVFVQKHAYFISAGRGNRLARHSQARASLHSCAAAQPGKGVAQVKGVFASVCHTERIDTHRCVRALVRSSV